MLFSLPCSPLLHALRSSVLSSLNAFVFSMLSSPPCSRLLRSLLFSMHSFSKCSLLLHPLSHAY
jgi:hypothetical protein